MDDNVAIIYLIAAVVGIIITYYIIAGAVSSGMTKTNEILKLQNETLLKLLNEKESVNIKS